MDLITQLAVNVGLHTFIGWFVPVYIGIANILPTLVILYHYADKGKELEKNKVLPDRRPMFDFIIVGGGTSGAIVASRLSENFNVLLLERGGDPNPLTMVPQLEQSLLNRPEINYSYRTEAQNNSCLSLNNKQAMFFGGMGLGGSSAINSMVYLRGHSMDYDNWARIAGDKRWAYEYVFPFFLKAEDYCTKCDTVIANVSGPGTIPPYHAIGGPIGVRQPLYAPLVPEFLRAMNWAKTPRSDLNSPLSHGCNAVTYTQRNSKRTSTLSGYLNLARTLPSLKIVKYARVYKVLFRDGIRNEAFGVEYERFGEKHIATAGKEIILSAGAIETAKILMLSGVGPPDHLQSLKIPLRVAAPVGFNLQDHVSASPGPFLVNKTVSFVENRDLNQGAIDQYVYNASGPYSSSSVHGIALWPSSRAINTGEANWPDLTMQFSGSGVHTNIDQTLSRLHNVDSNILNEYFSPSKGKDGFQITVYFGRPRSRGYVRLRSPNYLDDPIVDPRYYSDKEGMDMRVMIEGIKRAVYVAENAPSFRELGTMLSPTPFPACKSMKFRSNLYWECLIKHYTLTLHHFVGTAAMGPFGSPYAVVSPELKVHGALRLRVIDASVIPAITSADTMAPILMIGERGAQFIKDTWLPKSPPLEMPPLSRNQPVAMGPLPELRGIPPVAFNLPISNGPTPEPHGPPRVRVPFRRSRFGSRRRSRSRYSRY